MSTISASRPGAEQFFLGARACVPVCISVAAYGLVWGMLASGAGMSLLEVGLNSGLVFAGSAQFVALDLWVPGSLPIGALVMAVLIVNLRYLLITASLRPLFAGRSVWQGAPLMFLVTDENWAMTTAEMQKGRGTVAFLLGGGVLAYVCWLAATLTGAMLGSTIPEPTALGLDFAFTATFLALLLGMWRGPASLVPWVTAGVVAIVAARLVPGSWYIIIGGIAGSLAGALFETLRQREAKPA